MKLNSFACLFALLMMMGCDRYDVVMAGLPQGEANEALVLLRESNIDAKKEMEPSKKIQLYQIKVKSSDTVAAMRLLVDNRLPRTERAGLKDIYPPGSAGLIPTKSEEHARFLMASQGEVEALFKVIPGIKDARVVLSFDPPSEILKNQNQKTASVVLLYQNISDRGSPISDEDAKRLVASSINGLSSNDVTIVQKEIAGLTAETSAVDMSFAQAAVLDHEKRDLVWYMLALTIMALIVATYGMFRLFGQKRARA